MTDTMTFEEIVDRIRAERNLPVKDVPGFDPANGNESAKILFLLETPGTGAIESRKISYDNDDPTAREFKDQIEKAGICRRDIAIWNVVPWYLKEERGKKNPPVREADLKAGRDFLKMVITAMPELQCIVLVGAIARRDHVFLSHETTVRIYSCHHTSRQGMIDKTRQNENIEIFRFIKKILD